jgi:hypothetical protein
MLVDDMTEERLIEIIREEIQDAIRERSLTEPETEKKDRLLKDLTGKARELKKRYGKDWKAVMYGIATKNAKRGDK